MNFITATVILTVAVSSGLCHHNNHHSNHHNNYYNNHHSGDISNYCYFGETETASLALYCKHLRRFPHLYGWLFRSPMLQNVSRDGCLQFCSILYNETQTKQQYENSVISWASTQTNLTQGFVNEYINDLAKRRNQTITFLQQALPQLSDTAQSVVSAISDFIRNMDISEQTEIDQMAHILRIQAITTRAELWAIVYQLQTCYFSAGRQLPEELLQIPNH